MGRFYDYKSGISKQFKSALYDWLHIGSENLKKRQAQRIVLTNVMISVTTVLAYLHALVFILYDFGQLKYPILLLVVSGTALLATPFLNKKNPYFGSVYNLSIWLATSCAMMTVFGTISGLHFYFLAGAASAILIMGVYQNPLSVISLSTQIGLFMYFDEKIIPTVSILDMDPLFFKSLYFTAITLSMMFIFFMVYYAFYQAQLAEDALEREYQYSEKLLANLLPEAIAAQLKQNPGQTIANRHDNVTILFADIVDFTPRAQDQSATELVKFLNQLFTCFDLLTNKYGLEKIKTIGDAFMVAGGLQNARPYHAERMAHLALDMMEETRKYANNNGETLGLRIGIHTGPVVAGVIGTQRPFYDVWGDTVNTAAHLETYGVSGEIQVTAETKAQLDGSFKFKPRGKVEIKGKGKLDLWYLSEAR